MVKIADVDVRSDLIASILFCLILHRHLRSRVLVRYYTCVLRTVRAQTALDYPKSDTPYVRLIKSVSLHQFECRARCVACITIIIHVNLICGVPPCIDEGSLSTLNVQRTRVTPVVALSCWFRSRACCATLESIPPGPCVDTVDESDRPSTAGSCMTCSRIEERFSASLFLFISVVVSALSVDPLTACSPLVVTALGSL